MSAGSLLPLRANARLSAIYDREDETAALVRLTMSRISSLSAQVSMASLETDTTEWQDELFRLNKNRTVQQERARHTAAMAQRVREYVAALSRRVGVTITDAPPAKIDKLRKGLSLKDAVNCLRVEIGSVKANLQAVKMAAMPLADQKLMAREFVAKLVGQGRPRIVAEHDRQFEAHFLEANWGAGDLAAIAAWMDGGKALLAALERDLTAQPPPPLALTPKEKAERLATLRDDLLALEFGEEALIEEFEEQGSTLDRREDADPRALLLINIKQRSSIAA